MSLANLEAKHIKVDTGSSHQIIRWEGTLTSLFSFFPFNLYPNIPGSGYKWIMNEFASYFCDDLIFDIVIMNDETHFHDAIFLAPGTDKFDRVSKKVMAVPKWTYQPETEYHTMKVEVFCPVCKHHYPEATKRLEAKIIEFMKDHGQKHFEEDSIGEAEQNADIEEENEIKV